MQDNGTLTINQAGYLANLIRAIDHRKTMRWYPQGADTDQPMTVVLRAFTNPDGSLYPSDADIRDAYVWTSSMFEHWFGVRDVLAALANAIHGNAVDQPMAIIDEPPRSG